MKLSVLSLIAAASFAATGSAQTFTPGPADKPEGGQLEMLIKKIDEQNLKLDALSQQILKLEQQLAARPPGVIIGETTPAPPSTPAASSSASAAAPQSGNAHVVAKGETLTSIAKTHKVGVQELQKFNRIENDRALQIGQTIMIPGSGASPAAASPATSPSVPPNE